MDGLPHGGNRPMAGGSRLHAVYLPRAQNGRRSHPVQEVEQYIQHRDGTWYVGDTGVHVYNVISMWQHGYAPEEILHSFPVLSLQAVYETILSYLERREAFDAFFREQDVRFARGKAVA